MGMANYSDISVKYLDKIGAKTFATTIYNERLVFEEKIDGVKIHLIRNNVEFNPNDFTSNWIVSFKGSVLYPDEYDFSPDNLEKIKKDSIGARQYAFIFEHLRKIQSSLGNIPTNTEFFCEFSLRKPTVVSEYSNLHNLFLISVTPAKAFDHNGNVVYKAKGATKDDAQTISKYTQILKTQPFPVIFDGFVNDKQKFIQGCKTDELKQIVESSNIDFSDPKAVQTFISQDLNQLTSAFGGMAEGFVVKDSNGGIIGKVSRPGQARGEEAQQLRGDKKAQTRMSKEDEQQWYNNVEEFCRKIFDKINLTDGLKTSVKQFNDVVRKLSKLPANLKHDKLDDFKVKESIMLKGKLMLSKIYGMEGHNTKQLGLVVISGKPFHNGHYNLLEVASKQNDAVYAVTSDTSRDDFSGEWSIKAFEEVYLPLIRKKLPNVNIGFAQNDNPQTIIDRFLNDYSRNPESMPFAVTIYCHEKDLPAYTKRINDKRSKQRGSLILPSYKEVFGDKIKVVGLKSREDDNIASLQDLEKGITTNVSGTKMRELLSNKNKELFFKFLPHPLSPDAKEKIWKLFTGTENMNEALSQLKSIIMSSIKEVIKEGGNAPAINRDTGEVIANANETKLNIIDRSQMRKDMIRVFKSLNTLFEKKYSEPLWKDFSVVESGYAFNGSSAFFFDSGISDEEFKKHKPTVGDVDVTIPGQHLKQLFHLLSNLEGKTVAPNVVYVGQNKKSENEVIAQINAIFAYTQDDNVTNVQVDFEGTEYTEKNEPDEFSKFGHNSDWEDIKKGFKGVSHKFLLMALSKGMSVKRDAIVVTPKSDVEGDKIKPQKKAGNFVMPRTISFSIDKGVRTKYKQQFKKDGTPAEYQGKHIYKEIPSNEAKPEDYTRDLKGLFKLWFGKEPESSELKKMNSFVGVLDLMEKYNTQDQIQDTAEFLINDKLFGPSAQELVAPASMLPGNVSVLSVYGTETYEQAVQEAGHKDKNIKLAALTALVKKFPYLSSTAKDAERLANSFYDSYGKRERFKIEKQQSSINERRCSKKKSYVTEGGFRSEKTQNTAITPGLIKDVISLYHNLIGDFNKWMATSSQAQEILDAVNKKSKQHQIPELQPIKALQPIGSGTHFEKDLKNSPDKTYGDIDILTSFPLTQDEALNDPYKTKVKQTYRKLFLSYIKLKKPANVNVAETFEEQSVTKLGPYTYVIFDLPNDNAVQVDMVVTYHPFQEWSTARFTPQHGIKGFTIGKLYSTLAKYIGVSFEAEGAVARLKGGKIHVGSKDKDTTFELITLDFKNFLVDTLNYLAKIHGKTPVLDNDLKTFTGVDPSNVNMVDFMKGIVGFAKSLEKSDLLQYTGTDYEGNKLMTAKRFVDVYREQFKFYMDKKANAGKFDKAVTDITKSQVSKAKKDADYAIKLADKYLKV